MLDHVGFNVSDYDRSKAFYAQALAPLGIELLMEPVPGACGFGADQKPFFWIGDARHRRDAHVHVAFASAEPGYGRRVPRRGARSGRHRQRRARRAPDLPPRLLRRLRARSRRQQRRGGLPPPGVEARVLGEHFPQNVMEDADEIERFYDRCSDFMRALLDALADAPPVPRPFPHDRGRHGLAAAADRVGARRRLSTSRHKDWRPPACRFMDGRALGVRPLGAVDGRRPSARRARGAQGNLPLWGSVSGFAGFANTARKVPSGAAPRGLEGRGGRSQSSGRAGSGEGRGDRDEAGGLDGRCSGTWCPGRGAQAARWRGAARRSGSPWPCRPRRSRRGPRRPSPAPPPSGGAAVELDLAREVLGSGAAIVASVPAICTTPSTSAASRS